MDSLLESTNTPEYTPMYPSRQCPTCPIGFDFSLFCVSIAFAHLTVILFLMIILLQILFFFLTFSHFLRNWPAFMFAFKALITVPETQ